MPLAHTVTKGVNDFFALKYLGASTTEPVDVTITINDAGNVAAGALSMTVDALSDAITANAVIESAANGQFVVVTAAAIATATTLAVDTYLNAEGDGIDTAELDNGTFAWDRLESDTASTNLTFNRNSTSQQLGGVTHGSGTSITAQLNLITAVAPTLVRAGEFPEDAQILRDILTYGDSNAYFWGKQRRFNPDGTLFFTREGYGIITGVGDPSASAGIVTLDYTFNWATNPSPTYAA